MSEVIIRGLGHHAMWGLSSTFDVLEAIEKACTASVDGSDPVNILLVNPGDIRHIIYTISRRRRHSNRSVNFYILESPCEVLARDLLLLEAFLDFEVPIRQRANVFLEIFGNALVQERTARYIEQLGHKLINSVANNSTSLNLVDFQHMRYKDKDELENIFKNYSRKVPCDMATLRDHRMRGFYAERFDSRRALADWDFQYSLRETAASIVHITLYRDWREKGVAFEFGDQTYDEGNRTMMTYVEGTMKRGKDAGHHKEVKGFWGDIVASPYFCLGVDADSNLPDPASTYTEGLFEILNKGTGTEQHRHNTVEVAVFNMFSMLWEVETGSPYLMTRKNDIFSGLGKSESLAPSETDKKDEEKLPVIEEVLDLDDDGDECKDSDAAEKPAPMVAQDEDDDDEGMLAAELKRAECIVESFQGVKVFPLLSSNPAELLKKAKFTNLFDGMFVSSRAAQFLQTPQANTVLRDGAVVGIETGKYVVPLLRDQKKEFNLKEKEFAEAQGWSHLVESPVKRRRREEASEQDDVIFYVKNVTET
mmetsp:Transcript_24464/g.35966  ORF Transcript_24464/g.35966 Transcript_24464/m.35966 type:complete len:536 (-) Transcript_24464:109-1716(-)